MWGLYKEGKDITLWKRERGVGGCHEVMVERFEYICVIREAKAWGFRGRDALKKSWQCTQQSGLVQCHGKLMILISISFRKIAACFW